MYTDDSSTDDDSTHEDYSISNDEYSSITLVLHVKEFRSDKLQNCLST